MENLQKNLLEDERIQKTAAEILEKLGGLPIDVAEYILELRKIVNEEIKRNEEIKIEGYEEVETVAKSAEEIARDERIALCKAFKEMTLARIKFLTGHSSMYTPDEIRAVRECFKTIMELRI